MNTYFPGVPDSSGAMPIDVGAGTVRQGVDIPIVKLTGRRVRGVVQNAQSRVSLSMRKAAANALDWVAPNITEYNGSFEFHSVVPDSYIIYASTQTGYIKASINVGNRDIDDLKLIIQPFVTLTGHFRWDGPPPTDAKKMKVELQPRMSYGSNTSNETSGTFQIDHLMADTAGITVTGLGPDDYVKGIRYGNQTVQDDRADLTPGAELEITLRRGAASLDGTVESGPNATIVLASQQTSLSKSAIADDNGHFTITGIAPGEYVLLAFEQIEQDAWLEPDFLTRHERQGERVKFEEKSRESRRPTLVR